MCFFSARQPSDKGEMEHVDLFSPIAPELGGRFVLFDWFRLLSRAKFTPDRVVTHSGLIGT